MGTGHGVLGTWHWTWGTGYLALDMGYWVLGTGHMVLSTGNRIPGIGLWVSVSALPNAVKDTGSQAVYYGIKPVLPDFFFSTAAG